MHQFVSVSDSQPLLCLKGSQEVCVRPAEPDPDLWWTPTREHHPHQHHGVARTGVCFSVHDTSHWLSSLHIYSTNAASHAASISWHYCKKPMIGKEDSLECIHVAWCSCFLSNPASCISISSSSPSHVCFCAVCSRVAPWTGPAHCVYLLCCRCSGRLQHHRYSHPEIVSPIYTYIHIQTHSHTSWGSPCQTMHVYGGSLPENSGTPSLTLTLSVNPFYHNVPVFSWTVEGAAFFCLSGIHPVTSVRDDAALLLLLNLFSL